MPVIRGTKRLQEIAIAAFHRARHLPKATRREAIQTRRLHERGGTLRGRYGNVDFKKKFGGRTFKPHQQQEVFEYLADEMGLGGRERKRFIKSIEPRHIGKLLREIESSKKSSEAAAGKQKSRLRPPSIIDGEKDRLTLLRQKANSIASQEDRQKDFRERTRELATKARTDWRKRETAQKANFAQHKQGPNAAKKPHAALPSIASRNIMRRPPTSPRSPH